MQLGCARPAPLCVCVFLSLRSMLLCLPLSACPLIEIQSIDFLLHELKGAEEDHIDNTGSSQRHSQSAVVASEVFDLGSSGVATSGGERILLVDGLRDVDGVDLSGRS